MAHQTAQSSELLAAAQELVREDSSALFRPARPSHPDRRLVISQEGEMAEVATRRAEAARTWLQDAGVRMIDAKVGDPDPLQAIGNELQSGQRYEAIVLSTHRKAYRGGCVGTWSVESVESSRPSGWST